MHTQVLSNSHSLHPLPPKSFPNTNLHLLLPPALLRLMGLGLLCEELQVPQAKGRQAAHVGKGPGLALRTAGMTEKRKGILSTMLGTADPGLTLSAATGDHISI